MSPEVAQFMIRVFYPLVIFFLSALSMYMNYKKDRNYLHNMRKEEVLKETRLEKTIAQAEETAKLALANSEQVRDNTCRIEMLEIQQRLMLKAQLNTMKSLKAKGINGKTSESITEIENYLLNNTPLPSRHCNEK